VETRTGKSMTYSSTRRWCKWEVMKQMLLYFGDITPFFENDDIGPVLRPKLMDVLNNPHEYVQLYKACRYCGLGRTIGQNMLFSWGRWLLSCWLLQNCWENSSQIAYPIL